MSTYVYRNEFYGYVTTHTYKHTQCIFNEYLNTKTVLHLVANH